MKVLVIAVVVSMVIHQITVITIQSKLALQGTEVASIQRKIEEMKIENKVLENRIAEEKSLKRAKEKALEVGFRKTDMNKQIEWITK